MQDVPQGVHSVLNMPRLPRGGTPGAASTHGDEFGRDTTSAPPGPACLCSWTRGRTDVGDPLSLRPRTSERAPHPHASVREEYNYKRYPAGPDLAQYQRLKMENRACMQRMHATHNYVGNFLEEEAMPMRL
jgi:hypothetical protein